MIVDKAGQKGTGKWTSQEAMNLPTPIPTIDAAVTARNLSVYKEERVAASKLYKPKTGKLPMSKEELAEEADALDSAKRPLEARGLVITRFVI